MLWCCVQQYLAGGWGPVYSEAQMGVQGAPPSPSWYSLQGEHVSTFLATPYRHKSKPSEERASVRQMRMRCCGTYCVPPACCMPVGIRASLGNMKLGNVCCSLYGSSCMVFRSDRTIVQGMLSVQLLVCLHAGLHVSSGAPYAQASVGGLSSQFAAVSLHGDPAHTTETWPCKPCCRTS